MEEREKWHTASAVIENGYADVRFNGVRRAIAQLRTDLKEARQRQAHCARLGYGRTEANAIVLMLVPSLRELADEISRAADSLERLS